MERLISFFGLFGMVFIAYLFSNNKKAINWKTVSRGIVLQILFGLIILKTSFGREIFSYAQVGFTKLMSYAMEGSQFIFGPLTDMNKYGFIVLVQVLPTIILTSALMSVLYYIGIMDLIIKFMAKVMVFVMGTSGAESLAAAANVFAGQTEAPLVIKPFIKSMTKSELMALMTGGLSTVAGGVMAAYVGMGIDAGHILAASVMSAPAALVCAKLLFPETEESVTKGTLKIELEKTHCNLIDAASDGASSGMKLAINVAAMLIAFISLVAVLNGVIGFFGGLVGLENLSLELILGYMFSPISWMMGVRWEDCNVVGQLLGKKIVINEFIAYADLINIKSELSSRSVAISTYALCGFANFSSVGILIGGVGTIEPSRRKELSQLGLRALLGGTLACFMTACVAGIFL